MDNATALFRRLNRELWLVSSESTAGRGGLIATFVSQASLVPALPRVVVGIARQHHTWELIEESRTFALHLLGEEQIEWVWRFGLRSGREIDKLEGMAVERGVTGAPRLREALGWLECRVESQLETGDRTIYLSAVVAAGAPAPRAILTVQRMIELAPPERRQELVAQIERDVEIDARAIEEWRRQHPFD